jgi:hypothetical protein
MYVQVNKIEFLIICQNNKKIEIKKIKNVTKKKKKKHKQKNTFSNF